MIKNYQISYVYYVIYHCVGFSLVTHAHIIMKVATHARANPHDAKNALETYAHNSLWKKRMPNSLIKVVKDK